MIAITNSAEFAKLINALADDIVYAHIHWRLHCDLIDAIEKQPTVLHQSRTFWNLTIDAHAATAVERLCRAYDQEQSSLHLLSWLKTIQNNLHLFQESEFRKRLAGNAFVDSLAEHLSSPDTAVLEADILECTATNPLVKKISALRGSSVAHRSAKLAIRGATLSDSIALTVEDFNVLLDRARTILNRYSQLFSAETHSINMIGHDDFEYIFKSVTAAVTQWDQDTEG
jgi:hypothetical protein